MAEPKGRRMTQTVDNDQKASVSPVRFLWLEITGRCSERCVHCYADSGPSGSHGAMSGQDWLGVIDAAARYGMGMVQFIGGEPMLHPQFGELLGHAIDSGLVVEVFTNLVRVKEPWWELLAHPRVSLATSYYSSAASEHDRLTGLGGSHAKTRANIVKALARGIPLRAGVIDVTDGQRVQEARAELHALGVADVGIDRLRQVGRGVRDQDPGVAQLCGNCGQGVAAVSPDGAVWPCVFSRWLPVGNVRDTPLAEILDGQVMATTAAGLAKEFGPDWPCTPKMCDPQCGPSCSPACRPAGNCRPSGGCAPDYR